MADKTLAEPLTGEEIKAIIIQHVTDSLNKDTTLYDDIAYAGFQAIWDCKIKFTRSLTAPTTAWGTVGKGEAPPADATTVVVAAEYTSDQPDVARQEHNLPIPVLINGPAGPVRQKVRIEKAKR